ncbi:MAG: glycosyltransferase 87 family protein [Paracoccaceae bacterium]
MSTLRRSVWVALCLVLALTAYGVLNHRNIKIDFANFYDAGQKARVGEFADLYDPHALIAGKEPFGNMSFVSAPVTSFAYIPLTAMEPWTGTVVFKLAGALAEALALALLLWKLRPLAAEAPDGGVATWALFAWGALFFQPLFSWMFVGGQSTPFVFLLLVVAWASYLGDRHWVAAFAVALAVLVKPAFAPAALVLFLFGPARFRVAAVAAGAAFALVSVALLGVDLHIAFVRKALEESALVNSPWQNSNPLAWIEVLIVPAADYASGAVRPTDAKLIVGAAQLAAAAAVAATALWHIRSGLSRQAARHTAFSASLLVALVASPIIWSHYLILLLIPLLPLVALRSHLPRAAHAVVALGVLLAVFQNTLVVNKLHDMIGFDTQAMLFAIALLKGATALLMLAALLVWRRAVLVALRRPAWVTLAP